MLSWFSSHTKRRPRPSPAPVRLQSSLPSIHADIGTPFPPQNHLRRPKVYLSFYTKRVAERSGRAFHPITSPAVGRASSMTSTTERTCSTTSPTTTNSHSTKYSIRRKPAPAHIIFEASTSTQPVDRSESSSVTSRTSSYSAERYKGGDHTIQNKRRRKGQKLTDSLDVKPISSYPGAEIDTNLSIRPIPPGRSLRHKFRRNMRTPSVAAYFSSLAVQNTLLLRENTAHATEPSPATRTHSPLSSRHPSPTLDSCHENSGNRGDIVTRAQRDRIHFADYTKEDRCVSSSSYHTAVTHFSEVCEVESREFFESNTLAED